MPPVPLALPVLKRMIALPLSIYHSFQGRIKHLAQRPHKAKPDAEETKIGRSDSTKRRPAVLGFDVPTAAPKHATSSRSRPLRIYVRAIGIITFVIPIQAPFR